MSNAHRRPRRKAQRPPTALLDFAAMVSAASLGCTCTEVDVGKLRHGEVTSLSIGHDEGCPVGDAGSVRVALIGPGCPR